MEDEIPKKNKSKSCELVDPIILLERPEKEDLEPSKYIDHMCHNTPGNSTSGKYVIKTPDLTLIRLESGLSSWIMSRRS